MRTVLRLTIVWSIPLALIALLAGTIVRFYSENAATFVLALLMTLFLVSCVRASVALTGDLVGGRYDASVNGPTLEQPAAR